MPQTYAYCGRKLCLQYRPDRVSDPWYLAKPTDNIRAANAPFLPWECPAYATPKHMLQPFYYQDLHSRHVGVSMYSGVRLLIKWRGGN